LCAKRLSSSCLYPSSPHTTPRNLAKSPKITMRGLTVRWEDGQNTYQ
jgi:hypothetical protein